MNILNLKNRYIINISIVLPKLAPAYRASAICGECGVLVRGLGFVCLSGFGVWVCWVCCSSLFGWVLGASVGKGSPA